MNGGRCEHASRQSEEARFVTRNSELVKQRTDYSATSNNFCVRSFVYVVWTRSAGSVAQKRPGITPALVVNSF
jgi:hypothetical protein